MAVKPGDRKVGSKKVTQEKQKAHEKISSDFVKSSTKILQKELVSYPILAVVSILCIVLILFMFTVYYPAGSRTYSSVSPKQAVSQLETQNAPVASAPLNEAAQGVYDSKILPEDGIYICKSTDYSECASFCSQVNLKAKRCMIKIEQQNVDSAICACSKN
jgi:hypothetical protein